MPACRLDRRCFESRRKGAVCQNRPLKEQQMLIWPQIGASLPLGLVAHAQRGLAFLALRRNRSRCQIAPDRRLGQWLPFKVRQSRPSIACAGHRARPVGMSPLSSRSPRRPSLCSPRCLLASSPSMASATAISRAGFTRSLPKDPAEIKRRTHRTSRLIAKLRGHGLIIAKVTNSRLYRVTQNGVKAMWAAVRYRRIDFPIAFNMSESFAQ